MRPQKIGIVGGGPGGLMTAFLLEQRSNFAFDITIFEAQARLGGKIVTQQFKSAPVLFEAGAAELYDYSQLGHDPLRELVAELGFAVTPMDGKPWCSATVSLKPKRTQAVNSATPRRVR
jgi:predicted NAD/FAD-binding protein